MNDLVVRVVVGTAATAGLVLGGISFIGLVCSFVNTYCGARRSLVRIMTAELPTLEHLQLGEYGWTDPASLIVDAAGKLWLLSDARVSNQCVGKDRLQIARVNRGIICDLSDCPQLRWSRTQLAFGKVVRVVGLVGDVNWRRHATLPSFHRQRCLCEIKVGEECWCSSTALFTDPNEQFKLDGRELCHPESHGTFRMRVNRLKDGFECFYGELGEGKPAPRIVEPSFSLHVRSVV